jgi:hypothetical protein
MEFWCTILGTWLCDDLLDVESATKMKGSHAQAPQGLPSCFACKDFAVVHAWVAYNIGCNFAWVLMNHLHGVWVCTHRSITEPMLESSTCVLGTNANVNARLNSYAAMYWTC